MMEVWDKEGTCQISLYSSTANLLLTMGRVWGLRTATWFSHSSAMSTATGSLSFGSRSGTPPGVLSVRLSSKTL